MVGARGRPGRRRFGCGRHQDTTSMLPVMNPIVCMGPPNPSRKPPPHGTLPCQKNSPTARGVVKMNLITVCGPEVHGESLHRLAVSGGEAIGRSEERRVGEER